MDAVEKDVRLLVKKELRAANQNFPMFHSAHEGWAVIREEMSEADMERYLLNQWIEYRLWNEVKRRFANSERRPEGNAVSCRAHGG